MLTGNIFVEWLYNCDKRNSSTCMLYRESVQTGRAWYEAPGRRFQALVHTNTHCCHW